MKKKIAFLINHGVEVRHFLLSGLHDELKNTHEVCFLIRKEIHSDVLDEYLKLYNVNSIILPFLADIKKRNHAEGYISAIRKARKNNLNIGNFHNFNIESPKKIYKDRLVGHPIFFHSSHFLIKSKLKNHYRSELMEEFLALHNISDLVLLDFNSPFQLMAGFSANEKKINVYIVINTLKSYFINDYIPFEIKKLVAWDNTQTILFQNSNPSINSKKIVNGGNPYFTYFINKKYSNETNILIDKYPLLTNKKIILYSLIYAKIVDEFEIIKLINTALNEIFEEETRPVIVIRRNPFEDNDEIVKKLNTLNNILVANHYWERNPETEWSIQSIQGEKEWKLFLQEATLMMNIPSMSGYEALLSGTPVLNIGFDKEGFPTEIISHFTNAPFMKTLTKSKFVKVCLSNQKFKEDLIEMYHLKNSYKKEEIQNSISFTLFNPTTFLS